MKRKRPNIGESGKEGSLQILEITFSYACMGNGLTQSQDKSEKQC